MAGVTQTLTSPVAAKDDRNLGIAVNRRAANSPMSDEFLRMHRVRQVGWVGLAVFGTVGVAGLVLSVASAVAAGDSDLAPMPWIGIGMTLLVAGLAGGACFAVLLDVVEPIGWWRLLAIPPALVIGGFWAFVLIFGFTDNRRARLRRGDGPLLAAGRDGGPRRSHRRACAPGMARRPRIAR